MPNDCWNTIVITSPNKDELNRLYTNELLLPIQEEEFYNRITIEKKGEHIIKFDQITARLPRYDWLEYLLNTYPSCWIKNIWYEEDRLEGIWIGEIINKKPVIQSSRWLISQELYTDMYN